MKPIEVSNPPGRSTEVFVNPFQPSYRLSYSPVYSGTESASFDTILEKEINDEIDDASSKSEDW